MTATGFDIAIVGGGVIGLTLARALLKTKARVAVIDAGAQTPPATNAAAGMLAPSFEAADDSEALYALSAASLNMWPRFAAALEEESGRFIDFRDDGTLGVAYDETLAAALAHDASIVRRRGGAAEMLTGDEARSMEPLLSETVAAALYAERDAQVDPRLTLEALRILIEKEGAQYTAGRAVAARAERNGYALTLADANAARTVEADAVVIASGAAAASLIDGLPSPPVFPAKGEAVALKASGPALRRVVRAPGAYLCPKAGGRLVIGATEYADRDDAGVDPEAVAGLVRDGARAAPVVSGYAEIERWSGLRPATPDRAPILGRDPRGPENVFLALGHYRNGVLLAPATAEVLCDAILKREGGADIAPFRADRFEAAA